MKKIIQVVLGVSLFSFFHAVADDIDIYLKAPDGDAEPYVHLLLDYSLAAFSPLCDYGITCQVLPADGAECPAGQTCFSQNSYASLAGLGIGGTVTRFAAFIAVMQTVFSNPDHAGVSVALLTSNFGHGATILARYRKLGDTYATASAASTGSNILIDLMKSLPVPENDSTTHPLQPRHAFLEWYRYLNSGMLIDGKNQSGNFGGSPGAPTFDAGIIEDQAGTAYYISPFTGVSACPRLFSILFAMDEADEDVDLDSTIAAELQLSVNGELQFSEMLKAMHSGSFDLVDDGIADGGQPLEKSWVITGQASDGGKNSWAAASGSALLFIEEPAALEVALTNAFTQVISVSSTFVNGAVPANVFSRSVTSDNLYVSLFEARASQRWPGNIKKLKLSGNPGNPDGVFDDVVDVNGDPGFESSGDHAGRIRFDALTFWTDAEALPVGDGKAIPVAVDGRAVARGGAGQRINGFIDDGIHIIGDSNSDSNARQVFLEQETGLITNGTPSAFVAFDASEPLAVALQGLLNADNSADAADLIRWGRGQDVDNEQQGKSGAARPWLLADVIHSRPLAINYGAVGGYTADNPNIRLFFGSGDGMFHVLSNTEKVTAAESGREIFAFLARETLGNLKIRRDEIESASMMRYGLDGTPVALTADVNHDANLNAADGDEVYVYFGMRRGGRSYYSLNVSDPDADPKLQWKISKTAGGDFDELGLSFSTPLVGRVRYDNTATDVVIFAGGYHGGWDASYTSRIGKDLGADDDTEGNAIYIVNARDGSLIWKVAKGDATGPIGNTLYEHQGLLDSIPSDVTALKSSDGLIHRIYVGDTGGGVWRVDLPPGAGLNHRKDNWFISKLAELGADGKTTDRRFFHAPDVVRTFDDDGETFDGVLIASGDRAHPTEKEVINYLFYLKDFNTVSGDQSVKLKTPLTPDDLADQTACTKGLEDSGPCVIPIKGWKRKLETAGEKGLSTPLVDAGRVFFTTYSPVDASCEPSEGLAALYVLDLGAGTAVFEQMKFDLGAGIPEGPLALGDYILLPGSGAALEDLDGEEGLDISKLPGSLARKFFRIYWRESGADSL